MSSVYWINSDSLLCLSRSAVKSSSFKVLQNLAPSYFMVFLHLTLCCIYWELVMLTFMFLNVLHTSSSPNFTFSIVFPRPGTLSPCVHLLVSFKSQLHLHLLQESFADNPLMLVYFLWNYVQFILCVYFYRTCCLHVFSSIILLDIRDILVLFCLSW